MTKRADDGPLADRRADQAEQAEEAAEPDFAEEHAPSPTDPPNAEADTAGGEDDGYQPQTKV